MFVKPLLFNLLDLLLYIYTDSNTSLPKQSAI